jgi:putative hydrolase of the HAD superfamily
MSKPKITTLFCDVGGVLLTNGWDHNSRSDAVKLFKLEAKEFETRHNMIFGDYEMGKITLDEYLRYTVFFEPRDFSIDEFKAFMFAQSEPHPEMIDAILKVKNEHKFKVIIVSNEGKELTNYRIKNFGLDRIGDFFVISCYAKVRKPDRQIFQMAIDMSNTAPKHIAYIDDRKMFVEIAGDMGVHGIWHENPVKTIDTLLTLV